MTPEAMERAKAVQFIRDYELRLLRVGFDNEAFNFKQAADAIERGDHMENDNA